MINSLDLVFGQFHPCQRSVRIVIIPCIFLPEFGIIRGGGTGYSVLRIVIITVRELIVFAQFSKIN